MISTFSAVAATLLYVMGVISKDGTFLIAAALFALAANVKIKINIGGNDHD